MKYFIQDKVNTQKQDNYFDTMRKNAILKPAVQTQNKLVDISMSETYT